MLIKKRLPMFAIITVAFSLLFMSIFYYIYLSGLLTNNTKNNINQVLEMESISLETFFQTRMNEIDYLSKNGMVQTALMDYNAESNNDSTFRKDYTTLNNTFYDLVEKSDELRDIFVLTTNGLAISSNNPTALWIDLSDRQYFIDAMNGNKTISNLIANRIDGDSVLFVATPVHDPSSNEIIGVMGNIIDLKKASETLRTLVKPDIGDAYLIDESGLIIFHTDSSLIGTRHTCPEIDTYFQNNNLDGTDIQEFQSGKNTYYVASQQIPETPWRLVIEQNMTVILAASKSASRIMFIIAFITLLLTGFITYFYSKTITNPITKLSNTMKQTALGDLSVRSDYHSTNELGLLSDNFNHMLDALASAYLEVELKNEELTTTEEELRNNYEQLAKSEAELSSIQEKYILALKASNDVVWEWEYSSNQFFASDVWRTLTEKETFNKTINVVAFEELVDETEQSILLKLFKEHLKNQSEILTFTFVYQCPSGISKVFLVKGHTQWDYTNNPIKTFGTLIDITFEVESKEKIHNLAFINQISKLPNRLSYMVDIKDSIEKNSSPIIPFSVLQMDIDNFVRINNSLGHSLGDKVLQAFANRLLNLAADNIKVYHLAADEYSLIIYGVIDDTVINTIITNILNLLDNPFIVDNHSIFLSVSIGISIYPNDGLTAEKLFQNADTAMFAVKQSGKKNYAHYTKIMSESVQKKIEMETILRRAIKDNLVHLHYQPQYNSVTKKIVAFEALMRITTENGISISPADFIPIAEETGLIISLGEWVLRESALTCKKWLDLGFDFTHISVNVSGIQLKQSGFSEVASSIIDSTGIERNMIELEITESVLFSIVKDNENELINLSNLGYKIALDDFGTGYSSFSYLRTMPLTTLKIDKSFIDNLATSYKDQELIRQMIDIAHDLGLKVIAEGVETLEQYNFLKNKSCDLIQGYYFSKPLPSDQIVALMNANKNTLL